MTEFIKFSRKSIRSGNLKHRVTLQRRDLTPPSTNTVDFREVYTNLGEVWAGINTVSQQQPFNEINIDDTITHKIFIRYIPGLDTNIWILHGNERYNVIRIDNINDMNQWTVFYCNIKGDADKEAAKW